MRIAALLVLVAWPGEACAQPPLRVWVTELEGPEREAVEAVLRQGLAGRGTTVVGADATRADAIVTGRVRGRGRRVSVDLEVLDPAGEVIGRVEEPIGGAVDALVAILARLSPEPEAAPPSPAPSDASSSPASAPSAPVLRATVVATAFLRARAVELSSPDGVDVGYLAEPYFELGARAEVEILDVLFARVDFGSSVGLASTRPSGESLDSTFLRVLGDAGARARVDVVTLGAAIGIGWDLYELAFNALLPTTEYLYVRAAAPVSFELVERALSFDAELGVRLPFTVGELEALYGVDHDAVGLDGAMRLRGRVEPGFAWAVEAGFRRHWLSFARPGGATHGHDAGWHLGLQAGWTP